TRPYAPSLHDALPIWLTAIATVQDAAELGEGRSVLIHGGSGGVGQLLIPMALEAGASRVWATGRAANAERIRELGAEPIPYDEVDWREALGEATGGEGVGVVLDTHYFSNFVPSLDVLRPGGASLVLVLPWPADLTPARERRTSARIPRIATGRDRLDRLVHGMRSGAYPLEASQVLPLAQLAEAHRLLEDGHTRGKLVVDVRS